MSEYYYNGGEIYHYGVKGMKWGHRRAQKRSERADQAIRRIEKTRKQNKLEYDEMRATSRDRFKGKDKKLKRAQASNKALYDTSETTNKYMIARQKAKKDKNYKNSKEYQQAKAAYGKQTAQQMIFGTAGHQRIETLKNQGVSEKAARGRAAAEQLLLGAAVGGMIVGVSYLQNR